MRIVSLLTDFGITDPYVSEMKATILAQCPTASIVDVTHDVERHNIVHGAYLLEMAVKHFPRRSIHVAVVDPGVGSDRLPIMIVCKDGSRLIGPDNGLLTVASNSLGVKQSYRIGLGKKTVSEVSSTFHGRDLFAVAAGMLAEGVPIASLGKPEARLAKIDLPDVVVFHGKIECSVIHIDGFGNVITNLRPGDLSRAGLKDARILLKVRSRSIPARQVMSYYQGRRGELLVLEGSQGYMEIALREKSAAKRLRVKHSERIVLQQD